MLRNKVVWDKHYYSNRFTVRNIFLLRYSRFRLMCTFKDISDYVVTCENVKKVAFLPRMSKSVIPFTCPWYHMCIDLIMMQKSKSKHNNKPTLVDFFFK